MVMKEYWILINKRNGLSTHYYKDSFNRMKSLCKSLINLSQDDVYKIEYWKNGELTETVKMSDYFCS